MNYNDDDNEILPPSKQGKTYDDLKMQELEYVFEEYVKTNHLTHTKRVIEIRQEEDGIS